MALVEEILTKWGFKADTAGLAKVKKGVKSIGAGIGMLVAGATAVTAALGALAKKTGDYANDLDKTSQGIGIGVEELQKLRYAADINGVAVKSLNVGLTRFVATIGDARQGTKEAKDSLLGAGLTMDQLNDKTFTMEKGLAIIADKFAAMPDGIEKTDLAYTIFGRSGTKLIPMLNQGAAGLDKLTEEAEALGFIMSTKTVKSIVETRDNLDRIRYTVKQLWLRIGTSLIPVLDKYITIVLTWIKANKKLIDQKINEIIEILISLLKGSIAVIKTVGGAIYKLSLLFGGLGNIIKLVTAGFLIFTGAKIIFGIVSLVQGVMLLKGAMIKMGWAGAKAWAKILFPIAAVIAVLLVIEDFYNLMIGKPSVLAKIFKLDSEDIKNIHNWIDSILHKIFMIPTAIKEGWATVVGWITGKIIAINKMISNIPFLKKMALKPELISQIQGKLAVAGAGAAGGSPSIARTTNATTQSTSNKFNANIVINAPSDKARDIKQATKQGADEAFQNQLKHVDAQNTIEK